MYSGRSYKSTWTLCRQTNTQSNLLLITCSYGLSHTRSSSSGHSPSHAFPTSDIRQVGCFIIAIGK